MKTEIIHATSVEDFNKLLEQKASEGFWATELTGGVKVFQRPIFSYAINYGWKQVDTAYDFFIPLVKP